MEETSHPGPGTWTACRCWSRRKTGRRWSPVWRNVADCWMRCLPISMVRLRAVTEGVLPAQLLFAHPGYLRAARGIEIPGGHQLFLHACDVSRDFVR